MSARSPSRYRALMILLMGVALVGAGGFWFHTCFENATILGRYSAKYFTWLVVISVVFLGGAFGLGRFLAREQFITMASGPRLVPLRAKALSALALAAVLAAAGEWGLTRQHTREIVRRQKELDGYHPYLQMVPRPRDAELGINRWGFRGEDIALEKGSNAFRIFVLGGSTVLCNHVGFEESFCRLLEKRLRERYPGVVIEVQNAGMDWHTSEHSLMKFLFMIQDFKPDLIIVYHAINDLCRGFSPPGISLGQYRPDYGHYHGAAGRMVREYFDLDRATRSYLFNRIRGILSDYWFSDWRDNRAGRTKDPRPVRVTEWKSLPSFERNMADLARTVRSKGVALILASQPYLYKTNPTPDERACLSFADKICRDADTKPDLESMIRGMDLFNAASRRVAVSAGVAFVDLERQAPKTMDYFYDDVHYTPAGNRLICDTLFTQMVAGAYVEERFPVAAP